MKYLGKVSLAVTTLALSGAAFAGPDLDTRVQELEKQMKQVRTETSIGTFGANTALARPDVEGRGVFISLDVLYWQAKIGGTEYAYTDNDLAATMPIQGRYREADFSWDWGVRFGLGYNFEHGGWDVYLNYTYFSTNGNQTTSAGLNGSVVPLRGWSYIVSLPPYSSLTYFPSCTNATTQFGLNFDRIDLELGRNYFISKEVSFRPHFGLTTAWIDEKQLTRYTGGAYLGVNTVDVKDRSNFWGLGLRTGVNSKWYLTNGFSIFGNVSGALLYGFFQVQHKEWFTQIADNTVKLNANMHRFSPTAQMTLGLAYDQYIYNDKQHIGVSLGYDMQYWWRQNQMLQINDDIYAKYSRFSEDLSLYGITLDIRWDF